MNWMFTLHWNIIECDNAILKYDILHIFMLNYTQMCTFLSKMTVNLMHWKHRVHVKTFTFNILTFLLHSSSFVSLKKMTSWKLWPEAAAGVSLTSHADLSWKVTCTLCLLFLNAWIMRQMWFITSFLSYLLKAQSLDEFWPKFSNMEPDLQDARHENMCALPGDSSD